MARKLGKARLCLPSILVAEDVFFDFLKLIEDTPALQALSFFVHAPSLRVRHGICAPQYFDFLPWNIFGFGGSSGGHWRQFKLIVMRLFIIYRIIGGGNGRLLLIPDVAAGLGRRRIVADGVLVDIERQFHAALQTLQSDLNFQVAHPWVIYRFQEECNFLLKGARDREPERYTAACQYRPLLDGA